MRITRLKLQNFKNFDDVELHFGDVNIFVGANASGKSNLFEAIRFLRNINLYGLENAISLSGGIDLLGSVQTENSGKPVTIEIDYRDNSALLGSKPNKGWNCIVLHYDLQYVLDISAVKGKPLEATESLTINAHVISNTHLISKDTEGSPAKRILLKDLENLPPPYSAKVKIGSILKRPAKITLSLGSESELTVLDVDSNPVSISTGLLGPVWEVRASMLLENEPLFSIFNDDDPETHHPFTTLLSKNHDLHLFDGNAIRIYDFDYRRAKEGTAVASIAELEENGGNLAKVIQRIQSDPEQAERFRILTQSVLPYAKSFDVQKINGSSLSVSLHESFAPDIALPSNALSDGTVGVAAIIAALFFEKNSIAMFEEPERGVHPALLGNLMAAFYDTDKQVFLTTHSPEVLNYAQLSDIFLISRDKLGSSTVIKPAEKEMVRALLAEQVSIGNLFTQQLLDH